MVLRRVSARHSLLKHSSAAPISGPAATTCRVAVVISSKVSKRAVVRNRLRRRLHNHLRSRFEHTPEHAAIWPLVSLKPGAATEEHVLLEECDRLLEQAGLKP